jgi:predicted unusual protein kinase regulating ubiquinone biosynthesis (AarF/ABC1/UbiB family)
MKSKVSGSRFRRLTKLGWLSRHAVPIAWKRLREAAHARPEERPALASEAFEKHADVAEEVFRTLGELKGIALKVGQMAAYMDGAFPEEYRPVYQKILSRLLQAAPALPFAAVAPVIEADLKAPIETLFAELDAEPFAAASIGQVHRATLHSGEEVAVKIQYPGIEKALASDLKNAELFRSVAAPFLGVFGRSGMSANLKEVMAEIRSRLIEELDYEREAEMQERFRALFGDDREIYIPRVVRACSGRRVLTTELIRGQTLREVCDGSAQAERDRYGAALTRFTLRSIYEFHLFNADPHPGNYLFPQDGRVVILDFGCVKEIPPWMSVSMKSYLRASVKAVRTDAPADWEAFDETICEVFKLDRTHRVLYPLYREFILYALRPYLRDEPFSFSSDYTGESIDRVLDGVKKAVFAEGVLPRIPDLPPIPADFTFLNRLLVGFYSVLAMLRAEGNWHRMLPEEVRS